MEVIPRDCLTGGIYQLRQGQQRRICVRVKPVRDSGTLPLVCDSVVSIDIGSVCVRSKLQKPLDSYQEEDLLQLRDKWSEAVARRRQHLDQQLQRLMHKVEKSQADTEREQSLVNQWVSLTEERNAVLVPNPGSGIPGTYLICLFLEVLFYIDVSQQVLPSQRIGTRVSVSNVTCLFSSST